MFVDFFGVCFDQIFNQAAKFRYMFGGKAQDAAGDPHDDRRRLQRRAPSTRRAPITSSPGPGLKVVVPSNAYDAKGLLIQAIRDDDPVIFCEHKLLYDLRGRSAGRALHDPVRRGEHRARRRGRDRRRLRRAWCTRARGGRGAGQGRDRVRVVDPRTTSPLDEDTILESVEKTGRLVVVDERTPRCSIASDIAALVADKAFGALKAPIRRVTAPHTPVPFAPTLEDLYIPSPAQIAAAMREVTSTGDEAGRKKGEKKKKKKKKEGEGRTEKMGR